MSCRFGKADLLGRGRWQKVVGLVQQPQKEACRPETFDTLRWYGNSSCVSYPSLPIFSSPISCTITSVRVHEAFGFRHRGCFAHFPLVYGIQVK